MTLEKKWKTRSLKTDYARKRSTTKAANVDLAKSLLDSSLKNNHIIVDKIYYLRSLFVFFLRILVFKFISQPQPERSVHGPANSIFQFSRKMK